MRTLLLKRLRVLRWVLFTIILLIIFDFIRLFVPSSIRAPEVHSHNIFDVPGIEAPLWSSTKTMTDEENALAHFKKHGDEMGFKNAADYVREAQQFLRRPPQGTETKIEKDGDILRYQEETGRFGVMRADGAPRTFFIPEPDVHGASSNRAYFDRQD